MSNPPIPLLGRIAVHLKLISVEQLADATRLQGQAGSEKRLGEILVERGMLTQAQLEKVLRARQQMITKQRAKAAVEKALPEPEPEAAARPDRDRHLVKSADPARPHSKPGSAGRAASREGTSEGRQRPARAPAPGRRARRLGRPHPRGQPARACACTAASRRAGDEPIAPDAAERMLRSAFTPEQRAALRRARRGRLRLDRARPRPLPRERLPPAARHRRRVPLDPGARRRRSRSSACRPASPSSRTTTRAWCSSPGPRTAASPRRSRRSWT